MRSWSIVRGSTAVVLGLHRATAAHDAWDNRGEHRAGVAEWQTQLTQNQPRATS